MKLGGTKSEHLGAIDEFRRMPVELLEATPPLAAMRALQHTGLMESLGSEEFLGVGGIALDAGTGGCKLILWWRFAEIRMTELAELKLEAATGCKSWKDAVAEGPAGSSFTRLASALCAQLRELPKLAEFARATITCFFCGVTAWYRQVRHRASGLALACEPCLPLPLPPPAVPPPPPGLPPDAPMFLCSACERALWCAACPPPLTPSPPPPPLVCVCPLPYPSSNRLGSGRPTSSSTPSSTALGRRSSRSRSSAPPNGA